MKRSIAALAAVAVIAGGIATTGVLGKADVAVAQETTDSSEAPQTNRLDSVMTDLVNDGVITQEQADIVAERLRTELGNHRRGHKSRGGNLAVVTDLLEIEPAELREALATGQTLAEIAEDNGVSREALVGAIVGAHDERIDAAEEAGRLTAEEADERRANIAEHVDDLVDGELPIGRGGARGRGFGPGAGGQATDGV